MIRVYMRCGKCGKYENAADVSRDLSVDKRMSVMASDSNGNPYHVLTPVKWNVISLGATQAVLCPDCVPAVIREIESTAR